MKDTKYKILAYFDNQSYQKLFNEVNSDYAENLQILLHNLSLFSYDVLIIGVILYKENISNIISAIRKITQIPIIILTDASSLLCIKKMTSTPVDLPQEFFRINRDIWQALTIKVGASFLTLFQEQLT